MTKDQFQTIVGLLAGTQAAIAHLANVLCNKAGIGHEDLAKSFEEAASAVPDEASNRGLVQLSLRQAAFYMRNIRNPEWEKALDRLLH